MQRNKEVIGPMLTLVIPIFVLGSILFTKIPISGNYSGDSVFLVHGNACETLINDLETQRLDHA